MYINEFIELYLELIQLEMSTIQISKVFKKPGMRERFMKIKKYFIVNKGMDPKSAGQRALSMIGAV